MVKNTNYKKNNKRSVKKHKIVNKKKTQKGYGRTKKESVCNVEGREAEIIKSIGNGAVYLKFEKGDSNKFWQIVVEGNKTISTHGKIGSARPSETEKTHEDSNTSMKFAVSQICSKLDKGYEVSQKEKLSGKSALEKLEKAKHAIESQIRKAKELVQVEEVDKEQQKIESLKKEVQDLDTEIDKLKGNIEELNKQLIPLLDRKKTAELKIKDILNLQQRKQEREAEEKKEKQLKERLTVLKQSKGLIRGHAHSINISEEIERWEEEDDKNNKDDLFKMKTVDEILDTIGAPELKKDINFGDFVNFDSYRHYSCKIVNDLRELTNPEDIEQLTIGVDITKFLEDPVDFYDVNKMTGDDDGCLVAYVDFTLDNVKGDKNTKTKEIFDKFDVAEYIGNENTVFSYGYYDDSLYADGDELKKV